MIAHVLNVLSGLQSLFCVFGGLRSVFCFLAPVVFFLELFNTSSRVHELHLARVERVRGRCDFNFEQWVFVAVFPSVLVFTLDGRLQQETSAVGGVLEDDIPIFRVDVFFHWSLAFSACAGQCRVHQRSGDANSVGNVR